MQQYTCNSTEHKAPDAPLDIGTRDILMPQTGYNAQVDGCKPQIARESIEHSTYQGLLASDTCHLSIGRIAEVGKHQQQYAADIMHKVGVVEHPSCTHAQEYRNNCNNVGVDIHLVPQ